MDVGKVNMRGHMAIVRALFHSWRKGKGIYITEVYGIINRTEKRKKWLLPFTLIAKYQQEDTPTNYEEQSVYNTLRQ